ncbi:ABC transporter ATP-binding protein [Candidatus Mycoplasma mahonii]|uniref:ABC transporter ATP-binding protein n=1 Tax=Candidatus Mycoplasma mahonii TaxID=3004105 RepID=UPI0026EF78A1|nr:ABC transporter ATP-binding protein [Candidatus Mycoplasma mahonii]WKX02222.1 ABC transporter ATP-binding protein [Candidatus Mycoplasma mahonii]
MKSTLREFIRYYKPVIGLFLLDSFFAIILASISVGTPFLTQYIVQNAISSDYQALGMGIGFLCTLLVLRLISSAIVTKWGHLMGLNMEINMRREAVEKMHRLPMTNFDKTPTGSYISRIVSDLKDIPEFAHHGPEDLIIALLVSVGGFTYAFLQSWIIGTILVFVFIVGVIVIYLIRSKWRKIWINVREKNAEMSASIGFQIEGAAEIKSYNSEKFERERFLEIQEKYKKSFSVLYRFEAYFTVSNVLVIASTTLITTTVGSFMIADKTITLPQFVGLTSAAVMLVQPMQKFVNVYTMLSRGASSVDRFFEYMAQDEEKQSGVKTITKLKGMIEFRNVTFSYKNEDGSMVDVFKDFNLSIKHGEKIALIGETGIGKSTLLKLLLRFYDIQKGDILIDGISIYKYEVGSLRRNIGYVQQQSVMFYDTIENNILYGKPDATSSEVVNAAKNAEIYPFISSLEHKFKTVAGPRGAKLSGGQKQRIALARCFLADSKILLMDEATSALDNETESKIKSAVAKLSKHKTTLIVAHRLTTIKEVDRIIVLGRGGMILQSGSHQDLINQSGYYKDMDI